MKALACDGPSGPAAKAGASDCADRDGTVLQAVCGNLNLKT
jgi:hypothetical protein